MFFSTIFIAAVVISLILYIIQVVHPFPCQNLLISFLFGLDQNHLVFELAFHPSMAQLTSIGNRKTHRRHES